MNELAAAIEEVRTELAAASKEFFPERFTIVIPGTTVPDGFGGTTEGDPVEHKNIPGKIEVLGRSDQVIGGAQITNQTHKIKMGVTTITRNIKPHYQLIRQAQGDQMTETYENPVLLMGSMDAFVKVAATLKG